MDARLFSVRATQLLGYPFERIIIDDVARLVALQQELGVEPPIPLFVTLLDVANLEIVAVDQGLPRYEGPPRIDRPVVHLPDVVFDEFGGDVGRVLTRQRRSEPTASAPANAATARRSSSPVVTEKTEVSACTGTRK